MIQALAQFLQVCHEPHLIATVGFVDIVSESATAGDVFRDVTKDHEALSIRHKFLDELACKTSLELEEILL